MTGDDVSAQALALIVRATAEALIQAIEDAVHLGLDVQIGVAQVVDGGLMPQIRVEARPKPEEG
ncbi:hypothetical protein [Roseomonas indoligenes]|uniref:Uncharacterized protein n=1 Tax=Roseomonas indoligenes TaxID=2820811 RepID=A0A940MX80_9PROT|nr:hypothetical protein [Pararoseomonas indoligenes]MBP0493761.1 hypothetical protein [Pararoseomonas indoligenes]